MKSFLDQVLPDNDEPEKYQGDNECCMGELMCDTNFIVVIRFAN